MVNLYGSLGRRFQKEYGISPKNIPIRADSAWKAFRMLEANFKGFAKLIKKKGYYTIFNNRGQCVSTEELTINTSNKDWNFMPIALGCGGGGAGNWIPIIVGAALIGAAIFTGGLTAPALHAYTGLMVSMGTIAAASSIMMGVGVSLLLYGLSAMFFGPQVPKDSGGFSDDRKSFLYRGPVNTVEPGATISLIYGHVYVGSIVASGGIQSKDYTPS